MTSSAEPDTDVDTVDTVEPEVAGEPPRKARRPALPTVALTVAVALLVAATAVAGWFGVAWFQAANDDGMEYSRVRDEVNRVASAAIVTMNTLDYRKLDEGLANWADATTGPLHDEIVNISAEQKKALRDAKAVTSAELLSAAVRELDDRAGKAVVIAAVEITNTTGEGKPVVTYRRAQATLARTEEGGWKVEQLGPV
jgi:Mce-associated membrane protein